MVDLSEVADVEPVDQREVHLGVFDVKVALKVAGVLHCHDDLFFSQAVFAEDVEAVFCEVAVES